MVKNSNKSWIAVSLLALVIIATMVSIISLIMKISSDKGIQK